MKRLLLYTLITSLVACQDVVQKKPAETVIEPAQKDSVAPKRFYAKEITNDSNLENTTGRKLVILYNSVENFLETTDKASHRYTTECMGCEPLQAYNGHFVFAGQLEIFDSLAVYNETELSLPTNGPFIKRFGSNGRDEKPKIFKFTGGSGEIRYTGQACTDANKNTVTLNYRKGRLRLKNVLNAAFFEFDMDGDGLPEQYILANRNCSQELAILKIE